MEVESKSGSLRCYSKGGTIMTSIRKAIILRAYNGAFVGIRCHLGQYGPAIWYRNAVMIENGKNMNSLRRINKLGTGVYTWSRT